MLTFLLGLLAGFVLGLFAAGIMAANRMSGMEAELRRLEEEIEELRSRLGDRPPSTSDEP